MRNRRAFTLIELLVVVAIIIALLAILLPSMGRAIQVTEQAVCLSNQRQIGVGMLNYLSDNYGVYPAYFMKPNAPPSHDPNDQYLYWFDAFRRNINGGSANDPNPEFDLYACPSDTTYNYNYFEISYGFNYSNFGDWGVWPHVAPSLSQVTRPGESLIVGDGQGINNPAVSPNNFWKSVITPSDYRNVYPLAGRHVDGATGILFADGHVGAHDAAMLNTQWRTPSADYWWDANEGPRTRYSN